MLITILLTALLIWMNNIRTLGQFAAFCVFEFVIWIIVRNL